VFYHTSGLKYIDHDFHDKGVFIIKFADFNVDNADVVVNNADVIVDIANVVLDNVNVVVNIASVMFDIANVVVNIANVAFDFVDFNLVIAVVKINIVNVEMIFASFALRAAGRRIPGGSRRIDYTSNLYKDAPTDRTESVRFLPFGQKLCIFTLSIR
jgi:mitogen-activated protein kinase 7